MKPYTVIACSALAGILGGCLSSNLSTPTSAQEERKQDKVHEKLQVRCLEVVDEQGRVFGRFECRTEASVTTALLHLINPTDTERPSRIEMNLRVPKEPTHLDGSGTWMTLRGGEKYGEMNFTDQKIDLKGTQSGLPKTTGTARLDADGLRFFREGSFAVGLNASSDYPSLEIQGPSQGIRLNGGGDENPAKLKITDSRFHEPIAEFPSQKD